MTTPDQQGIQDLIKALEQHHEQYIRSLRNLHAGLNAQPRPREGSDSRPRAASTAFAPSPPLRGQTISSERSIALPQRVRRDTLDTQDRSTYCPSPRAFATTPNPNDSEFAVQDDEFAFIPLLDMQKEPTASPKRTPGSIVESRTVSTLQPMSFSDDELLRFLRDTTFTDEMAVVMEETLRRRHEIDLAVSFGDFASFERESYLSSTFEVYEVSKDAVLTKKSIDVDAQGIIKFAGDTPHDIAADGIIDAPIVWDAIKTVNPTGDSVGRITIIQEPTPLMLAALQLTMSPHFDMSELLYHLLSDKPNKGRTHAFTNRAFERGPTPWSYPISLTGHRPPSPRTTVAQLRQRSFFFVFKYYTSVGDGLEPAPWQRFERRPSDKRLGDHIDIAECSSVLALSLRGDAVKSLRMRPRRERAREGFLYDTFGPWHLLSIQSFPDDDHSVRGENFLQKSFCNGPYAFLELLISEYRDAGKRNMVLHEKITKLITPPTEFMFDRRLRDKLLFEDKHFTYIRRYFWAYNTLAVINTGIAAMISAYIGTFTEDFWDGSHPLLWPHPNPESADGAAYADKMGVLRRELDKVVSDLGDVQKRNERTRKEIENLRDQLFSGSSIKESRRAIDQGDNIRILTMISMIFLPLTFVTSVFGITEFTIPATDWRFALTMILVCVPFMIVICLLQTRGFTVIGRMIKNYAIAAAARWRRQESTENTPRAASQSQQGRGRKRRLVVAARGRVVAAPWRWRRLWNRRNRPQADDNIDMARV